MKQESLSDWIKSRASLWDMKQENFIDTFSNYFNKDIKDKEILKRINELENSKETALHGKIKNDSELFKLRCEVIRRKILDKIDENNYIKYHHAIGQVLYEENFDAIEHLMNVGLEMNDSLISLAFLCQANKIDKTSPKHHLKDTIVEFLLGCDAAYIVLLMDTNLCVGTYLSNKMKRKYQNLIREYKTGLWDFKKNIY
jgi:hypothetical protein